MTEGEAIDRLIHAMTQRHSIWSDSGPGVQALMNRAVDSCMKDCVEEGYGFEAVSCGTCVGGGVSASRLPRKGTPYEAVLL